MVRLPVEFPIAEAEALLKRLGPDGVSMSAEECDLAQAAAQRVEQAVRVERGPGGLADSQTVIQRARDLVGQEVVLNLGSRGHKQGHLTHISESTTLVLQRSLFREPVPTSLVKSIEPAEEERAAA